MPRGDQRKEYEETRSLVKLDPRKKLLYESDLWEFTKNVWYYERRDMRGRTLADCLGECHKWMCDWLRWEEFRHPILSRSTSPASDLPYLIPPPENKNGRQIYPERWVWLPVLDWKQAVIQEGPNGPVSDRFYKKHWRGLIIRFCADGFYKANFWPRGHLKTEIASGANILWRICRAPGIRVLNMSETADFARDKVIGPIKEYIEKNPIVASYWDLYPEKDGRVWTQDKLRVKSESYQSAGDMTMIAFGMESSKTGRHSDYNNFDDVVGETNIDTDASRAKVQRRITSVGAIGSPGYQNVVNGTRWHSDDAYKLYFAQDSEFHKLASFLVASVKMEDDTYLWPTEFNDDVIAAAKASSSTYFFNAQYYNQPWAADGDGFNEGWIRYANTDIGQLVKDSQASAQVSIVIDPAKSTSERADPTAVLVFFQDRYDNIYLVDGIRERIPVKDWGSRLADFIAQWHILCDSAKIRLDIGIESTSFQAFAKQELENELILRRVVVELQDLKPTNKRKTERIKQIAWSIRAGRFYLPERPIIKADAVGGTYSLSEAYLDEFRRFPISDHDDLLDCHHYFERYFSRGAKIETDVTGQVDAIIAGSTRQLVGPKTPTPEQVAAEVRSSEAIFASVEKRASGVGVFLRERGESIGWGSKIRW